MSVIKGSKRAEYRSGPDKEGCNLYWLYWRYSSESKRERCQTWRGTPEDLAAWLTQGPLPESYTPPEALEDS